MIYRVKFYSGNHKRFWSTVVRASTPEKAVDVAWANPTRPEWCRRLTASVSEYDPRTDPAVRGFVREVCDK
jgi:hypothetical protein